MGSIERIQSTGQIEKFGMSSAIEERLTGNFASRGCDMARLLLVTLTETPYTPMINGERVSVDVSNKYSEDSSDTVVDAREALQEAINARAPGMSNDQLLSEYKTRYKDMAAHLEPSRKDGKKNKDTFEESFVSRVRDLGIVLPDPETGRSIIHNAPKKITGLKMDDFMATNIYGRAINDFVTTDGRIVKLVTQNVLGSFADRIVSSLSDNIGERGGRAPDSRIVSKIKDRVVDLRTRKSAR